MNSRHPSAAAHAPDLSPAGSSSGAGVVRGQGIPVDDQALVPTYNGYIASTHDALLLFEACNRGMIYHVKRRPHDRERNQLIRSGNIFIFDEMNSGIKRWTDGIAWSPSRILGNFLVYRQLERPFAPGEKKRTTKHGKRRKHQYQRPLSVGGSRDLYMSQMAASSRRSDLSDPESSPGGVDAEPDRALVGSLVNSYGFKDGGLIKKTMSVLVNGNPHHLVSYYRPEDVLHGTFSTPSNNPVFKDLTISPDLLQKQNFRITPETSSGAPLTTHSAPEPSVPPNLHDVNTFAERPMSLRRSEPAHQPRSHQQHQQHPPPLRRRPPSPEGTGETPPYEHSYSSFRYPPAQAFPNPSTQTYPSSQYFMNQQYQPLAQHPPPSHYYEGHQGREAPAAVRMKHENSGSSVPDQSAYYSPHVHEPSAYNAPPTGAYQAPGSYSAWPSYSSSTPAGVAGAHHGSSLPPLGSLDFSHVHRASLSSQSGAGGPGNAGTSSAGGPPSAPAAPHHVSAYSDYAAQHNQPHGYGAGAHDYAGYYRATTQSGPASQTAGNPPPPPHQLWEQRKMSATSSSTWQEHGTSDDGDGKIGGYSGWA